MTLTPTTTPTLTGLHLRLPTPASIPKFSPHLNQQSTGRSMLVQDLLNLHLDPTPSRRRNVRSSEPNCSLQISRKEEIRARPPQPPSGPY